MWFVYINAYYVHIKLEYRSLTDMDFNYLFDKNFNRKYLDKKQQHQEKQQHQQQQQQQQQKQTVNTDSGIIPKPPPFLGDLTKLDKQNNNVQTQHTAIQTTATVHVAKTASGNLTAN